MKKILFTALLMPLVAVAGDRVVSVTNPNSGDRHGVIFVKTFCEFGFQFLAVVQSKDNTSNGSGGTSVIQVMRHDGSALKPLQCQEIGK